MSDEDQARMYSICDLTSVILVMIHESFGDTCYTESIQDTIYEEFEEQIACDILEELIEIHCNGNTPRCLGYLIQITRHDDGIMLTAVTPQREEDLMIYTFMRCFDD
jgi:hypothetical protein